MEIKANTDIRSCAMITAWKGTYINFTTKVRIDKCNTQLAAAIRPSGITIFAFRNHTPMLSPARPTKTETAIRMSTEEEKTSIALSEAFRPISMVMNRPMATTMLPDKMENKATNPPTAL